LLVETVMSGEAFRPEAVNTIGSPVMQNAKRDKRPIAALAPSPGAQVMQLDWAGFVGSVDAAASHATKPGKSLFVLTFYLGH
jgi:hypothetical protein